MRGRKALLLFILLALGLGGALAEGAFPPLDDAGFLGEGEAEFVFADPEQGVWRYASPALRIEITRHEQQKPRLRYLAAEIFVKPGAGGFRMVPVDVDHLDKVADRYKKKPVEIARDNGLVFSMCGDYFLYRVGRTARVKSYAIGVEIRDHKLLFDKPAAPTRNVYPPLDMLALFEDGDMRVYAANELTAEQLLFSGARDVLSFGPVLIRDGLMREDDKRWGTTLQPRAAVGMVEKGHYWALIVEGRVRPSRGTTVQGVAEIMQGLGCRTAFNLDGGWTSAMVFMGRQLNQLDNTGVRDNARPQNEVMGIGFSQAVLDMKEAGK